MKRTFVALALLLAAVCALAQPAAAAKDEIGGLKVTAPKATIR